MSLGSEPAGEAQREQAALLLEAQRVGRMGSWAFHASTGMVQWSEATCELFGIAPHEFQGTLEHVMSFVLPEDRHLLEEAHARVTPASPLLDVQYRMRRPGGEVRWMRTHGITTFDAEGRVVTRLGMVVDVTEQKHAEAQLARSVALARMAGRVARVGGWTIDLPERKLTWSDENCAIHDLPPGYEPSLEEGIHMFPPEYRDQVRALVADCAEKGTPYEFELPKYTAKGRRIWVHSIGEAVRDAQGRIVRLQGAFQDITERKQAEEAVRERDALLHIAGRMARIGGWAIERLAGQDAQRVFWTDEVYDILEFDRGMDPPLEHSLSLYLPPWRDRVLEAMDACWCDGVPFDFEAEMSTSHGRRLWVRVSGEAARDASGHIHRVQGAFQDLTRLKAVEEAARESDERFALLVRASNDAIWDWDVAQNTLWWNAKFEALCPPDASASPQAWREHIHPDDRARVLRRIDEAMASGAETWSENYRALRRDHQVAHVIGRGFILRDLTGEAVRMVGSVTDISERMALEEQLRQSQRLESVGQLTGGVAHDFNNLLTVILGNAEMLCEELAGDPRLASLAQVMVQAAQRGADLTQRLLAFGRRQALEPQPVDINGRVAGMDAILRRALGEAVHVEFAPAPDLWPALVDPAQLDNTLLNLSLNARDAMPQGGRLRIETGNIELGPQSAQQVPDLKPGDYVMLAVSDTGTGIAPENLGRVFEPFFTTKEKGKGTGLGLSMAYGFVKQSGGHVALQSGPGRGTTVRLYLPRASQTGEVRTQAASRPAPPVSGGAETILLVEDDPLVRDFARTQLLSLGYTVLQAQDGAQAMQVLASPRRVDLLFTDVVMPGMSGRELAERACRQRPGLRVLYASGYPEDTIVHRGRLDAGVQLLAKPYRRDELARRIRLALDAG
ncbi:MAG: PAS domain-containing protein [Burkholderiales bacterium]|nr:PAS domain-containing protein [Burkholderiales bacterium]